MFAKKRKQDIDLQIDFKMCTKHIVLKIYEQQTINFNRFICVSNNDVSVVQKVCFKLMITIHVCSSDNKDGIYDIIKG